MQHKETDNTDELRIGHEADVALPCKELGLIVWRVKSASHRVASVRYRCMLPAAGLERMGYQSLLIEEGETLSSFDGVSVIVFVKSFSNEDWELACRAKQENVSVIVDLCDNIFVPGYGGNIFQKNMGYFQAIAKISAVVITTNNELALLVKREAPEVKVTSVIFDQLETEVQITYIKNQMSKWRNHYLIVKKKESRGLQIFGLKRIKRVAKAVTKPIRKYLSIPRKRMNSLRYQSSFFIHKRVVPVRRIVKHSRRALFRFMKEKGYKVGSYSHVKPNQGRCLPNTLENNSDRDNYIESSDSPEKFSVNPTVGAKIDDLEIYKRRLPKVIWFGNQGADYSKYGMSYSKFGMQSILFIEEELKKVYQTSPFQLLVVSKSESMYLKYIKPLSIPTAYCNWDPVSIFRYVEESKVCIIPNSLDEFSIYKSANRALLSLSMGTPVVATRIPSFEPLKNSIILDDWVSGIERYLNDPEKAARDVKRGKEIIQHEYTSRAIANCWLQCLNEVISSDIRKSMS